MSSSFEIVDRRGSNKAEAEKPSPVERTVAQGEWKDVDYIVAMAPQPNGGMLVLGKVVGLRTDGETFTANWLFTPQWKHNEKWQEKAKKRLDTFLDCECSRRSPCAVHKMYMEQWQREDIQRLELAASEPLSEALERFATAENAARAKASPILVPRG